ncbi:hypothetical protein VNI00_018171 [Paramarasmius palmivorus]|uniref:Uncharacterized protein n=1 Tax=Paramarasmius palmivorus TaxID=297713 RepID=A0AAW0B107_9AGAR
MAFPSCRHHILVILSLIFSTSSLSPRIAITVPHSVTAFTRTQIGWDLTSSEPLPSPPPTIGIWISSIGHCTNDTVKDLGVVSNQIDMTGSEGMANLSGYESMVVSEFNPNNKTALLCAYLHEKNRDDEDSVHTLKLLNQSAAFKVTFPAWGTTTVTRTETSTSLPPTSSSSPDSIQASNLSTGEIVGIAIGSAGFVALSAALLLIYRCIRYQRRLKSFHNERMTMMQIPRAAVRVTSPTARDSVGAQTIFSHTEVGTDYGKEPGENDDGALMRGKGA